MLGILDLLSTFGPSLVAILRGQLTYFAAGDLHTYRHGTKVRVEGSTTHPAQLELLRDLFGGHAKPIFVPTLTPNGHYALRATYDLSSSFDFLLTKAKRVERSVLKDDVLFYSALGGFSDAESHVGLSMSGRKTRAEYSLSNMNRRLLDDFLRGLDSREYGASIYATKPGMFELYAHSDYVLRLLTKIQFRHKEKIVGRQLAFTYDGHPWSVAGPVYKDYRRKILAQRDALEAITTRRFILRADRRRRKQEIFNQRVESTYALFARGLSVEEVADSLNCSIRTAYRRKERFRKTRKGE